MEDGGNARLTSEGPYRKLTLLSAAAEDAGEYVCDTDGDSVFFQLTVTGRSCVVLSTEILE